MKVFGTDIQGCLTNTPDINADKGVLNILDATIRPEAVLEMQEWGIGGWVPSIVTALPSGNENMLAMEMWLSKNKVPYSNLLMGVTSFTDAAKWLNLSFMITAEPHKWLVALALNKELKLYVSRSASNKEFERFRANPKPGVKNYYEVNDRIKFINSFKEIKELENA